MTPCEIFNLFFAAMAAVMTYFCVVAINKLNDYRTDSEVLHRLQTRYPEHFKGDTSEDHFC